jgi:hypothetical protein
MRPMSCRSTYVASWALCPVVVSWRGALDRDGDNLLPTQQQQPKLAAFLSLRQEGTDESAAQRGTQKPPCRTSSCPFFGGSFLNSSESPSTKFM